MSYALHRAGDHVGCPKCQGVLMLPGTLEPPVLSQRRCDFCGEAIQETAKKCKHCREFLDPTLRASQNRPHHDVYHHHHQWHPGIAAVLSLLIPGAGQMYKGEVGSGIAWLVVVCIGYLLLIVPGIILHIFCIVGAASGDPNK